MRSAGEVVAGVAARLSDDLLAEEERAFAEIDLAYTSLWADVVCPAVASMRGVDLSTELRRSMVPGRLTTAAELAGVRSLVPAAALLDRSIELVVPAMTEELEACESAMARRFRGVAAEGMEAGEAARQGLYESAFGQFQEAMKAIVTSFQVGLSEQLRFAVLYGDDGDRLMARLTSPTPVRLAGSSGRGVWWRPMTTVKRVAREASIGLTNELGLVCMDGYNRAARLR